MIVNKKINITPIKSMFNSILLGNEVELDIISNFTIPYTSDTILKVFRALNSRIHFNVELQNRNIEIM